jgi:hypothetical protein
MPCQRDNRYYETRFNRAGKGILAVFPANQEVFAVYPELSSTILPHRQEIRFYRGDSFTFHVSTQNDAQPPSNVDISRSVIRFAARQDFAGYTYANPEDWNASAVILKKSYVTNQIEVTNELNGQFDVKIKRADTIFHPLARMGWDVEVTRPTEHLAGQPGTVSVQTGSPLITGLGTDFTAAGLELGDIIHVQGLHLLVTDVLDERIVQVDFTDWTNESGLSYNLYKGETRTVASGPWTCIGDRVI